MISFIIPTLNEEKVIGNTLANLSDYKGEKEIILSDGNSRDQTLVTAKKYTNKIYIHTSSERQTIAGGRNAGANLASGEFLAFIDADVTIPDINHFFKIALACFATDHRLVALTVQFRVLPELATMADRIIFKLLSWNFYLFNNVLEIGGSGGEFQLMRASAFKQVGGFNEKLVAGEDFELFARLAKIGRTRYLGNLSIYHTGRRAHKIGWPKLLWQWSTNYLSTTFFNRAVNQEWTEVR